MADEFDDRMRDFLGLPAPSNKSLVQPGQEGGKDGAISLPPLEVPSQEDAPEGDFDAKMKDFLQIEEPSNEGVGTTEGEGGVPYLTSGKVRKSYSSVFADALSRGTAQIKSALPTLKGVYAEATGDSQGAQEQFLLAQQMQKEAPEQYQEFSKIRSLEDLSYWATEKFGEQAPNLATLMATGGIGALVGRGLLSGLAGRYLASRIGAGGLAGATGVGLETADTADTLRQTTGSYHPGVAITAGLGKGALEVVTPLMLNRFIKEGGTALLKGGLSAGFSEGATEFLQNEADIWARRYADPSFDPWSPETWLQRAEATAAGFTVGGGVGMGAAGTGKAIQRVRPHSTELSAEELSSESPINWLRKKFRKVEEPDIKSPEEIYDPGTARLLAPMTEFGKENLTAEQTSRQGEWIERNTPRYIVGDPSGEGVKRLLNSTDANTEYVTSPLHFGIKGPNVYQVAQGALVPANITASLRDAGHADPGDVYFIAPLPKEEQEDLKVEFRINQPGFSRGENRAQYEKLLNQGLRVIPMPGGSIDYVGEVRAQKTKVPDDRRSSAIVKASEQFTGVEIAGEGLGYATSAVDLDRVPPGEATGTVDVITLSGLIADDFENRPDVTPEMKEKLVKELKDGTIYWDNLIAGGVYLKPNPDSKGIVFRNPQLRRKWAVPGRVHGTTGRIDRAFENYQEDFEGQTYPDNETKSPVTKAVMGTEQAQYDKVTELVRGELPWLTNLLTKLKVPLPKIKIETQEVGFAGIFGFTLGSYWSRKHEVTVYSEPHRGLNDGEILTTLFHEYGHAVTISWWGNLPSGIQQAIFSDYKRHLLRDAITGKVGHAEITTPKDIGEVGDQYYHSFTEYLAEQFRRYAHLSRGKDTTFQDKAFIQGAQKIKEYWEAIELKHKDLPSLVGGAQNPSREFMRWMDFLENGNYVSDHDGDKTWYKMALSGGLKDLDGNYPAKELAGIVDQVIAAHAERLLPEGVTVERAELSPGEIASTSPDGYKIRLSAAAARYGAEGVLSHELIHTLKKLGLIHPHEWNILLAEATFDDSLREGVDREYRALFVKQAAELEALKVLPNANSRRDWIQRQLDEEYVGELLRKYVNGQVHKSSVAKIFEKIMDFLQSLFNRLQVDRLDSPERIMQSIWRGEISARSRVIQYQKFLSLRESRREEKVIEWRKGQEVEEVTSDDTQRLGDGTPGRNMRGPAEIKSFPKRMHRNTSRLDVIFPEEVGKVNEGIYYAREDTPSEEGGLVQFRFYKAPKGDITGLSPEEALFELGDELGHVELQQQPQGWEVEFVDVRLEFRRQRYAEQFYNHIEDTLGVKMKPSGILTAKGYAMWQHRDPTWLRYHIKDPVGTFWYSPNYVVKQIAFAEAWVKRAIDGENKKYWQAQKVRWEKMKKGINEKAWNDPQLKEMFMSEKNPVGFSTQGLHLGAKELEASSPNEFSTPEGLGFEEKMTGKMREGQKLNAKILGIPEEIAAPPQTETEGLKQVLRQVVGAPGSPLSAQADRIGWFSKRWWSIKQLSQVNPHITQLTNYVNQVEEMQSERARWLSRADETARKWDLLPRDQRDALADMMFWLTNMDYRSAAEVANNVVRQPTNTEIESYMRQNGMDPQPANYPGSARDVFDTVRQDFLAFLQEYEAIAVAQIGRIYPSGSQGHRNALAELGKDMAAMRAKPYFPMTRFGKYTVTVRDQNRVVIGFWAYPSAMEQKREARRMAQRDVAQGNRNYIYQLDIMPENVMEFQGLPPHMIRAIKANLPGGLSAAQRDWLDRFELEQAGNKSFKKRWLERKGTEGYSLDALRAYSHYFMTGSNYLMRLKHKDILTGTVNNLENLSKAQLVNSAGEIAVNPNASMMPKRRLIVDYLRNHLQYMMESGQDYAKTKALISLFYLGYSPVAAATNLTQTPMLTMPMLSQRFNGSAVKKAFQTASRALNAAWGQGIWHNAPWPGYEIGRQEMLDQGRIDAGQAQELGAFAEGNNLVGGLAGTSAQRVLRKFGYWGMKMFQQTERLNRELTYAMSFQLAMEEPNNRYVQQLAIERQKEVLDLLFRHPGLTVQEANAITVAKDMIDRSQFIYAPYNRPAFMRGRMGRELAIVLVFYQFMQNTLFTMRNDPAAFRIMAMVLLFAGLQGLPGAEEIDELIGMLFRKNGMNVKPSIWIREQVKLLTEGTMYETVAPDLILRGISRYGMGFGLLPDGWGAPFSAVLPRGSDFSANVSMGRITPGGMLGEAANMWGKGKSPGDAAQSMMQTGSGAGLGYMGALLSYLLSNPFTQEYKDLERVMPRAMKGVSKGLRYYYQGKETLRSGAALTQFDVTDPEDLSAIGWQLFGAVPRKLTEEWEARGEVKDVEAYYQARKSYLYEQMFKAIENQDQRTIQDVKDKMIAFNKELTEKGWGAMGFQPSKVIQSMKTRKKNIIMEEKGLPTRKSSIPMGRDTRELWPGLQREKVK